MAAHLLQYNYNSQLHTGLLISTKLSATHFQVINNYAGITTYSVSIYSDTQALLRNCVYSNLGHLDYCSQTKDSNNQVVSTFFSISRVIHFFSYLDDIFLCSIKKTLSDHVWRGSTNKKILKNSVPTQESQPSLASHIGTSVNGSLDVLLQSLSFSLSRSLLHTL